MKSYLTFFIVAVMTLGLLFLLLTRPRTPHDAPAEVLELTDAGDGGVEGGAADAGKDATATADATAPKPAGERPLRVTGLGWELLAPGATLGGVDAGVGTTIEIAPETGLDAVEARLARGGADPAGADIAILPLPSFVAGYERIRALDPRAFLVVGFSRGREELHAAPGALAKAPPAADEVKVVGLVPGNASDLNAKAAGSESATVFGLFALDLLGVAPTRVRFVAPGTPEAKASLLGAVIKGAADDRKVVVSTTDATRLVPVVAIAPRAVIDASEPKLRAFSAAWLEGLGKVSADASGVARKLAAKEGVALAAGTGGAPEAIALLERLGQLDNAKLTDEPTWIGASAKGPVTLETLTQRTWHLARAGGLTSAAAPEPLPIDARVVTAMAIAPKPKDAPKPEGDAGAATTFAPLPAGGVVLVSYRAVAAEADAAQVAAQIGFLSGVFERAAFRVSAKGGDKAAKAIAQAAKEKFDLPAGRLATVAAEPQGAFAQVDVVALP